MSVNEEIGCAQCGHEPSWHRVSSSDRPDACIRPGCGCADYRPSLGQVPLGSAAGIGSVRSDRVPVGQPVVVATPVPVHADAVTGPVVLPFAVRRRAPWALMLGLAVLEAALLGAAFLAGLVVMAGA